MKNRYVIIMACFLFFAYLSPIHAQRSWIKSKVKQDMKEKYAEPEKEKGREEGREAIKEVTYENDSRYPVPENPIQATIAMELKSFKKNGKLKDNTTTKLVFGKTGECMIANEGTKEENRILFDYKGAAMYVISPENKTATKMPIINFHKMAEKLVADHMDLEDENGLWQRTNETQTIHGYHCQKYIYTNTKEKTTMHAWVTKDISINLSGNHLFGGQIKDFSSSVWRTKSSKIDENYPQGMMVRSVFFENNNETPNMQMDITLFEKTSNPEYFNLENYKIMDVLDKL